MEDISLSNPLDPKHVQKHTQGFRDLWLKKILGDSPARKYESSEPQPFITISRQAGAGGHTLAQSILDVIQKKSRFPFFEKWQIFDNELCQMVLQDERLKLSPGFLTSEKYHSDIEDLLNELIQGESPQYLIHRKMFECVRAVARKGKAIIVGRCGVCLTRDFPSGIHIRLIGPLADRIQRLMTQDHLTQSQAAKQITEWDQHRARLMKTYFGRSIEDPFLYDAVWNTSQVSMETIAESVVHLLEKKSQNLAPSM